MAPSNPTQTATVFPSSQSNRDHPFLLSLIFVLEPKHKSIDLEDGALPQIISQLDRDGVTVKDPRSKRHWFQASSKLSATTIRRLMKQKRDFDVFIVREVRTGAPEETRIRQYISKLSASNAGWASLAPGVSMKKDVSKPSDEGRRAQPSTRSTGRQSSRLAARRADSLQTETPASIDLPAVNASKAKQKAPRSPLPEETSQADGPLGLLAGAAPDDHEEGRPSTTISTTLPAVPTRGSVAPWDIQDRPTCITSHHEETVAGPSNLKRAATEAIGVAEVEAETAPAKADDKAIKIPTQQGKRVRLDLPSEDENCCSVVPVAPAGPTIHSLPPKCLQCICVHATPNPLESSARSYRLALYRFMSVCSDWKTVAEGKPSLWTHFANGSPPGMLDASIVRSSGILVTVQFDGLMEYGSKVEAALNAFVSKVVTRRLDWKSVHFTNLPPTTSSVGTIRHAMNGSTPELISATFTTSYNSVVTSLHEIAFDAPSLRHLAIGGLIPCLSNTLVYANLETLCLGSPLGLAPAALVRILGRNDKLRRLELDDIRVISAHLFQHPGTFQLSELVHFKLHLLGVNRDTAEMAQIFTRLRAPKCRSLDLAIDMDNLADLNLEFNEWDFSVESFLIHLGTWMSGWIVLGGDVTRSSDRWLEFAHEGATTKAIYRWQYVRSVNGEHRDLFADVSLHVDNRDTKKEMGLWAEDVKIHGEFTLAALQRGVHPSRLELFETYRRRVLDQRERDNAGPDPADFMGIRDTRRLNNRL